MPNNPSTVSVWQPWILALRPQSLTASLAPVLIGTVLALSQGISIDWMIAFSVLLSAFFIQTGTNLVNDAFDYKRGADTEDRLGPIRLVQRGLLSSQQVHFLGILSFLLAILVAIPIILKGGGILLFIILLSCLCGYFYTGGSISLAYTGLADFFVVTFFGVVLTGSTYYLQSGIINANVIVAGLQIGLLATVIIAINNLRDHVQDAQAGRRSLPVRFGVTFGRCEITFCSMTPLLLGFYWFAQGYVYAALLPLLTLPIIYKFITGIWKNEPGRIYNSLFGMAALTHLLFGLLISIGFMI